MEAIQTDWMTADLPAADRALLSFAVKLTKSPGAMTRGDVDALREAGFDESSVRQRPLRLGEQPVFEKGGEKTH